MRCFNFVEIKTSRREIVSIAYESSGPMSKNKKIFLALFVIFMLIMCWIGYDISRRTTFPGSKGNLKERISTEVEKEKK